jgi:hypothetical protein
MGLSSNGRTRGWQSLNRGSIPLGSTNRADRTTVVRCVRNAEIGVRFPVGPPLGVLGVMTKFLDKEFSVPLGSPEYRSNWDNVFGKKTAEAEPETPPPNPVPRGDIYAEIEAERLVQDAKYGGPEHDDAHPPLDWMQFINLHSCKALIVELDPVAYRKQLVRIAALAVAAAEVILRRNPKS